MREPTDDAAAPPPLLTTSTPRVKLEMLDTTASFDTPPPPTSLYTPDVDHMYANFTPMERKRGASPTVPLTSYRNTLPPVAQIMYRKHEREKKRRIKFAYRTMTNSQEETDLKDKLAINKRINETLVKKTDSKRVEKMNTGAKARRELVTTSARLSRGELYIAHNQANMDMYTTLNIINKHNKKNRKPKAVPVTDPTLLAMIKDELRGTADATSPTVDSLICAPCQHTSPDFRGAIADFESLSHIRWDAFPENIPGALRRTDLCSCYCSCKTPLMMYGVKQEPRQDDVAVEDANCGGLVIDEQFPTDDTFVTRRAEDSAVDELKTKETVIFVIANVPHLVEVDTYTVGQLVAAQRKHTRDLVDTQCKQQEQHLQRTSTLLDMTTDDIVKQRNKQAKRFSIQLQQSRIGYGRSDLTTLLDVKTSTSYSRVDYTRTKIAKMAVIRDALVTPAELSNINKLCICCHKNRVKDTEDCLLYHMQIKDSCMKAFPRHPTPIVFANRKRPASLAPDSDTDADVAGYSPPPSPEIVHNLPAAITETIAFPQRKRKVEHIDTMDFVVSKRKFYIPDDIYDEFSWRLHRHYINNINYLLQLD
jgi:hypothetical protein